MPQLPAELVERILNEVCSGDWESLKTCALVSPTFLQQVRQILFWRVNLTLEPDDKDNTKPSTGFGYFLTFLVEDKHVATYIREMAIIKKPSFMPQSTPLDWSSMARLLQKLSPKLMRLFHLSITSSFLSDWTILYPELRPTLLLLCGIPSLKSLEISYMGLTKKQLLSLVKIPRLTLHCNTILPNEGGLESLSVPIQIAHILPSSSPHETDIRLRDLTISAGSHHFGNHSEIWSIVAATASKLISFKYLSSPHDICVSYSFEHIGINAFPSLASLTICICLEDDTCISKLISLFSQLTGNNSVQSRLGTVEICCDFDTLPPPDTLSTWDWHSLETALTNRGGLTKLREVKISVKKVIKSWNAAPRRYAVLEVEALEVFKTHLPLSSTRGLITGKLKGAIDA